jgi:putative transposase
VRLKEYDYSQAGAYFITIVAQDRACLFGEVIDGDMRLNAAGEMLAAEWDGLPNRFRTIETDTFVVMPNHVHGIIVITANVGAGLVPVLSGKTRNETGSVGAGLVPAPWGHATTASRATTRVAPTSVGDVVGAFKSMTTVLYGRGVRQSRWRAFCGRLWQRNYYEHIIRDDAALQRIREYIIANPTGWEMDAENPTKANREVK